MNENYLWDKSGEDAEIKHLENVLQAYRQTETLAPVLPKNNIVMTRKPSRKVFRLAFAAAACLVIALFSLGMWRQIFNKKPAPVSSVTVPKQDVVAPNPKGEFPENTPLKITDKKLAPKPQRFFEPVNRVMPAVNLQNEPKVEKIKFVSKVARKPMDVKLTNEEKFAYDQLKLALSITSSQLKNVKDKVDGGEIKPAASEKTTTK